MDPNKFLGGPVVRTQYFHCLWQGLEELRRTSRWNASPFRMKIKKMAECRLVELRVWVLLSALDKHRKLCAPRLLVVCPLTCSHNPTLGTDCFPMVHSAPVNFTFLKAEVPALSFVSQIFRSGLKDIFPSIMYFSHGFMALSTTYQQLHQNCPSP